MNGDLIRVNDPVSWQKQIETYYSEKFLSNYRYSSVDTPNQVRKNVSWDTRGGNL